MNSKSNIKKNFQWVLFMCIVLLLLPIEAFVQSFQIKCAFKSLTRQISSGLLMAVPKRIKKPTSVSTGDVEDVITSFEWLDQNFSAVENPRDTDKLNFPEASQSSLDEKAIRKTPFGKILFGVIDVMFPVFKEPNWFDVYGR